MLTSRGLHRVLGDLAEAGYNAAWMVLGAADVGAPHRRDRIWILAETASHDTNTDSVQCSELREQYDRAKESAGGGQNRLEPGGNLAYATGERLQEVKRQLADLSQPRQDWTPDGASRKGQAEGFFSHALLLRQGGKQCRKKMEKTSANADVPGCEKQRGEQPTAEKHSAVECGGWWGSEPALGRVAHGVAHRVDRLKAIGNGQVPLVAATAFCELKRILEGGLNDGLD